ncbi:MAG: TSUP family transporter [Planctomycetes bacterium]|nr:TSUP family transporter [Planctomycetota bacterium]
MTYLLVIVSALLAAALTLFSGFGLGSLLLPVFALYFPLQVAVGATAVVHLANNFFKLGLVGRHARWGLVLRFGLPAVAAALLGALILTQLADLPPLRAYELGGRPCKITWIGLVMGALIAGFAALDLIPVFDRLQFSPKLLPFGGLLSGFFGGLSGHQGALRAAFLAKCGLTKEAFVGTGVACAVLVDLTRLPVYFLGAEKDRFASLHDGGSLRLLIAATLAAFLGSFIGARLLKKATMKAIQRLVGAMLFLLAAAITAGLV